MTDRPRLTLPTHDVEDLLGEVRRQRRRHLVEQQDIRLGRERAREVDDPQDRERQVARVVGHVECRDAQLDQPVAERPDRRRGQAEVGRRCPGPG